ncbi:hypothetical protein Lser_V15G30707 [Lactuca serriola]
MSSQDNYGLPSSFGNNFHLSSEDDLPLSNQCENVISSSENGGTGHHASPTFPPPMTHPTSRFSGVERYETTQALLTCKHKDENSVCAHVLEMKSYIDKLDRMGVVFPWKQAIDLVLLDLVSKLITIIGIYLTRL